MDVVLIAKQVVRVSGKDSQRKLTTYDPQIMVAETEAAKVVSDLNGALTPPKEGSKTERKFVIMPTEGPRSVPFIADADAWQLRTVREAKRKAIESIPAGIRKTLGIPDADADNKALDAWQAKTIE